MKKKYIAPKSKFVKDLPCSDILQGSDPRAKIGVSSSTNADEEEEILTKERFSGYYEDFDF